ncbi:DNA/RNA non-specific endonuclease [Roseivirga sp. UBA1976]|uniref:DNA/RNA non-specific endonuclease n=1 Tax=Roseivirga sp. UBA1976 TaxID=1947386 RepID=UPI00257D6D59|nr:DNA/RNA non-specific endonuclease [Roseivirga sp. UBA1976]MEC7755583.1 DNA/RNA non-specific endonuclease [Bacteroidota bacterium]|tara:strand:+ start:2549 stop:3568 length:1020 start_codon:yes stop_codon:yes gene_type:complete
MAQKRKAASRKTSSRAGSKKNSSGFSLGKFILGVLILGGLGYTGLALREGELVPESIREFRLESPLNGDPIKAEPGSENTGSEVISAPESTPEPSNNEDLNYSEFDLYFTSAFDFMWPAYNTNDAIIERPYYTLRYNEDHEQAMWVAYKLVADSLNRPTFDRADDFREDPRVRTGSASLADYRGSGYDRGHLAPAADFSYDEFALSQSFYMSNMSPQDPGFNRGIWKKLESKVRDWAKENGVVYVVTGPVLKSGLKSIGPNKVSVPEYYYKIVLDIDRPEIKAIAFLMKNEKSSNELSSFVVTIDEIERLTRLDFFPSIPDELENMLESTVMTSRWNFD